MTCNAVLIDLPAGNFALTRCRTLDLTGTVTPWKINPVVEGCIIVLAKYREDWAGNIVLLILGALLVTVLSPFILLYVLFVANKL